MTNYETIHRVCLMAGEDAAREILELRDRVATLDADNAILRETVREAIAQLHTLQIQNARLRTCLKRDLWERYGAIVDRRAA